MTVDIRHNFVSTVPSSGDPSIVQGPNWNEAHILQQGPTALLGRSDVAGSQQPTQEIPLDPATMQFTAGGALGAKAQPSPAPTWVTMNGWLQRPVNSTIGVQLNTPIPNAAVGMMLMVQTAGIMRLDGMNSPDNGVYNLTNTGDVINAPAVTQIPVGSAVTVQQAISAGTGISITGSTLYPTISATGAPPTGTAGGDLQGSYPNPTLNPAGTLNLYAMVQSPHFTGSPAAPTPPTADNSISIATTQYVKANLAALPTTLPPSGPAGGQLAGTYPNPTIAGGADGYVLTSQLGQALWTAPGAPPTGIAGGMLSGAYPNPNIRPSVTNGQVMTTVGGVATWAAPSGGASISVGDTPPGSPSAGALWWNSTLGALFIYYTDPNSSQWVPAAPSPSGAVLQTVSVETGAMATGTTLIPGDDTIPQITEGDQYMTLAIIPRSATSRLIIEVTAHLTTSSAAGGTMAAALFQDSTANALACGFVTAPLIATGTLISFKHIMTSGTTSATTFRVRGGFAAAGTTTFNGYGGGRLFGGTLASSIVITEVSS